MTPLRLGPLHADGFSILRSGIRWLHPDGYVCRAREPVAFCNVRLRAASGGFGPFAAEARDFQVAFAPTTGGRIRQGREAGHGGDIDRLPQTAAWDPEFVIGHVEADGDPGEGGLELLMLAGRRVSEFVEVRSQIHAGWHDRSRAWWSGSGEPPTTLLGAGICEQTGILRGELGAYFEAFETQPSPLQIVTTQDEPLVPRARILLEGLRRTPEDAARISEDLVRTFAEGAAPLRPADWVFVGALLNALGASPISERFAVLTRSGLHDLGPARHVLLSLHAEGDRMFRHKRLGYHIDLYGFRFRDLGPTVQAWMRAQFDLVPTSLDDIARDYGELLAALATRTGAKAMIMNKVAARWHEDVWCYAGLPTPLGDRVATIRTREQNLMLSDVAARHGAQMVDVDAIASNIGIVRHVSDGVHQSGPLQAEVRAEIFRLMRTGT